VNDAGEDEDEADSSLMVAPGMGETSGRLLGTRNVGSVEKIEEEGEDLWRHVELKRWQGDYSTARNARRRLQTLRSCVQRACVLDLGRKRKLTCGSYM
jgi:hypothetical protein